MKENKGDKWLDYLTAHGFDTVAIYNDLITRIRREPKKLMNDLLLKSQLLLSLEPQVKDYLVHVSPYHRIEKIMEELIGKFKLSGQHTRFFMDRYLWVNYHQDQLFDYLQKQKIKLKVKLHRGHYEVFVFVTEGMRQNFKRYGDVVHVTFNFVPTKRNPLMRVHYMGIFSGVGLSGDMVIFGLAVVVGSTPSFRGEAVQLFLSLASPYRPAAIIGQHSQQIKQVVKNFNQTNQVNIKYFENWHHTLERAQKQFQSQPTRRQIILKLKKLLLTFNPELSEQSLKNIDSLMQYEQNRRLLREMLKDTVSYWSDQNPCFIGFEIQANHHSTISEIVNSQFGYSPKLGNLIYDCLQFERKINLSANQDRRTPNLQRFVRKYENIQVVDQMVIISTILSAEMYKKLFYNYYIAHLKCQFKQTENPLKMKILQFTPTKNDKKQLEKLEDFLNRQSEQSYHEFIVNFNVSIDCWECECKMIYWSGIPCAHLIKVILFHGGSLEYYINSRWIKKVAKIRTQKQKMKQLEKIQVTNDPSSI